MPSYRFRARKPSGKVKPGFIEAPTEAEAVAHLRKGGLEVLDIQEAPPAELSATPFYRAAVVLVALGLIWALVSAAPSRTREEAQAAQETTLRLTGRVLVDASGPDRYSGVRLRFHFPEVPLDVERSAPELELVPDGIFTSEITLTGPVRPTWCSVKAWKEGAGEAIRERVELGGDPPTADVGVLRLAPPQPPRPERPAPPRPRPDITHQPPSVPYSDIATPEQPAR